MPNSKMRFHRHSFRTQGLTALLRRGIAPGFRIDNTLYRLALHAKQRWSKSLRDDTWEILAITLGIGAIIGFRLGNNQNF
jgi:hypothetical protein